MDRPMRIYALGFAPPPNRLQRWWGMVLVHATSRSEEWAKRLVSAGDCPPLAALTARIAAWVHRLRNYVWDRIGCTRHFVAELPGSPLPLAADPVGEP